MRRKRQVRTPRYSVDISLRAQDLAKAGCAVSFQINGSNGRLGTVEIGQGSFRWRGSHDKRLRRISWRRFFDRLEGA